MIAHLSSIYEDPYRIQNARLEYKSLMMRPTETFSAFQTRFLHLAGQAQIPLEDLIPDLFDKLTLDLQRATLPFYTTAKTLQELTNHCLALDQGLRRIKARSDRLKARNTLVDAKGTASKTTTTAPTAAAAHNPPTTPGRTSSRETTPAATTSQTRPTGPRPTYDDPRKQALSIRGACFSCGQEGHRAWECPTKGKDQTLVVQEVDIEAESGKEEP